MPKPEYHIFICGQHRPEGHPRGSCGAKAADSVFDAFAQELIKANLTNRVALTRTGCLGPCQAGANVLIYPGSQMYSWVENADAAPIIKSMLAGEVFADKATPAELW